MMNKYLRLFSALTAACLWITACATNGNFEQSKTVIITPAIAGNSASLSVGDTLEVQIPTIPKNGFEWQLMDLDTKIVEQVGAATYIKDTSPNSAGGTLIFRFIAMGTGNTTIKLLYVSSSSETIPALSSNSLSVTVEVK